MSLQVAIGIPGSGKSNWALGRAILTAIGRPQVGLLVFDFHGRLTKEFALWMIRKGQAQRMTYDDLGWDQFVPGYKLHEPLTEWSFRGEIELEAQIEGWVQFFVGSVVREPAAAIEQHAYYDNSTRTALELVLQQAQPLPLTSAIDALDFDAPDWDERFTSRCWSGSAVRAAERLKSLTKSNREREVRPVERALRRVLGSPVFRARCDGQFDLVAHLAKGGIHVVSGSPLVAESAQRMQAWMLIQRAIIGCMQGGFPLEILIDEFDSLGVNPWIQRKAEELRKFDCGLTVLSQSGDWGLYTERFLNAAASLRLFKLINPATRQRFSGFLDPELNPLQVKQLREQWHSETDYVPETRITKGESWNGKFGDDYEKRETTTETTVLVPRVQSIKTTTPEFASLEEQERMNGVGLWQQSVGTSVVATPGGVHEEYARLVRPAFPAPLRRYGEKQFEEYCQWLWQQPGYRKVGPPQSTGDAALRLARVWALRQRSNGHAGIPALFKN